jgi:hypothetical protein
MKDHGICKDERGQEQPKDKARAQQASVSKEKEKSERSPRNRGTENRSDNVKTCASRED